MNSFVDNPFLFFVDNVPPIFADNPEEDRRKIIEISDVGCDAVASAMALHNNGQYNSPMTATVKSNRIYKEKPRQNDGLSKDFGKTFIKHPEINHRTNVDEQRWKKPSTQEDVINAARRPPDTKDANPSPRVQSAKPRLNRWSRRNVADHPPEVQRDHEAATPQKRPVSCPTRKRPLTQQSAIPRMISKLNAQIAETTDLDADQTMVALEPDYPDVFDSHVSKDRWHSHRPPSSKMVKKPSNENLRKTHQPLRYQRVHKTPLAKSEDTEQSLEDTLARRMRSRTRSPPRDRRKSAKPCCKPIAKQPDQAEVQQTAEDTEVPQRSSNSSVFKLEHSASDRVGISTRDRSSERTGRFVDRAVDKDSISDIVRVSTSTDATVAPSSSIDTGKSEKMIGFWEFVSLDEEGRRKISGSRRTRGLLDQRLMQDTEYHPPRRHLINEDNVAMADEKSARRNLDLDRPTDLENSIYVDRYLTPTGRIVEVPKRIEESARSVEVLHRTKPDTDRRGSGENLCSNYNDARRSENWHDRGKPKYRPDAALMHSFGWTGYSRNLKRGNEGRHGAESEKRKKMENEDKMAGAKFIAAARMKRKLEESLNEDSILRKLAGMNIEKKLRSEVSDNSRLPIRIGKRLRSKNPIAWKFRGYFKNKSMEKEEVRGPDHINPQNKYPDQVVPQNKSPDQLGPQNKSPEHEGVKTEAPEGIGSVRSRTKPRIKPSVEHHRIVIDSDGNPMCQKNVGHVRRTEDSSVDEGIRYGRDAAFREGVDYGNVEQGLRRNEFANRFYAREINQGRGNAMPRAETNVLRNGFREKCFFNVRDQENGICAKHCKGLRCGKVYH